MPFLITGGASQTGTALANWLTKAGRDVVFASRSGRVPEGHRSVKLDWTDPLTLAVPFASGQAYEGVYIVSPPGFVDASENIKSFIDIAVAHGVGRFVLLSGTGIDKHSELGLAKVHRYLEDKDVGHFVLQPTWFIGGSFEEMCASLLANLKSYPDNFLEFHRKSISDNNEFKTVMPKAKIPLVSVEDIGRFAAQILLNEKNERTEQRVLGPELLTYDQVSTSGWREFNVSHAPFFLGTGGRHPE